MVYPNFNIKKGYRVSFNRENNQKAVEVGLRVSFGSGGHNSEHNGGTILIL